MDTLDEKTAALESLNRLTGKVTVMKKSVEKHVKSITSGVSIYQKVRARAIEREAECSGGLLEHKAYNV